MTFVNIAVYVTYLVIIVIRLCSFLERPHVLHIVAYEYSTVSSQYP
jgi:heme exporter protein D